MSLKTSVVRDVSLLLAALEVKTNLTPQRSAVNKFCDEVFHAGLLDEMHFASWAEPNRADPHTFANLTLGPTGKTPGENQRCQDASPWILRNPQATTIVLWLAEYSGWYLEQPTEMQRRVTVDIMESPGYNNSMMACRMLWIVS